LCGAHPLATTFSLVSCTIVRSLIAEYVERQQFWLGKLFLMVA